MKPKNSKLDNKKPPVKEVPPDEKEKENQSQPEKPVTTDAIEEKMLEGQEHVSVNPQENVEEKKEEEEVKEPQKKEIIIKPRENYLQDKISKMSPSKHLMSSIKKELGDKVKNILKEEDIVITDVPQNLKKFLPKEKEVKSKNVDEIYLEKQKYKEVTKMRDELNNLKKNLVQIEENEKLLKNEEFIKVNNSQKGNDTVFDQSIKDKQLKSLQEKKEKLIERIEGLEFQIKCKMEEHQTLINKEKMQSYLENFKRDKEIMEIKAKKFIMDNKKNEEKMKLLLDNLEKKRKEEIEKIEKLSKQKEEEKRKKFKDEEKKIELKHNKLNEELLVKYKPYINQKLEKNKNTYLYNKRYDNFKKKQEKEFKELYNKNKEEKDKYIYKFEDIDKFAEEFDEMLENRKYDQEQKSMELSQKWKENRGKLPKSKFQPSLSDEDNKNSIDREDENINDNEEKKSPFKEYADKIREERMPGIDENLKKKREDIINLLEDPKNVNKKYTLQKQKKKSVLLKKRDNSKPSKFKWELKLTENPLNKKEQILNENLIHRPKKLSLDPINRTSKNIPEKKPDYLKEMKNNREEKERIMSSKERKNNINDKMYYSVKKSKEWEKELNNSGNIINNINVVNEKVGIIEREVEQKEKLLELNGGIENNPKLGKEVGNLLLDSIEAKINLLKKMNKV